MYYKRKEHIIHWLEFQNIFSIFFLALLMRYLHVFMHTSRHLIQFKILDQSDLGAFSYKNYMSFLPAYFLATCQRGAALALAAACLGLGSVPMAMCLGLGLGYMPWPLLRAHGASLALATCMPCPHPLRWLIPSCPCPLPLLPRLRAHGAALAKKIYY